MMKFLNAGVLAVRLLIASLQKYVNEDTCDIN